MKRHASLNRIYRLIWSHILDTWIAVAETARGRGKGTRRKLAAVALSFTTMVAQAAPVGGQVTSGTGSISQTNTTTTVQQNSQNLSLNWQSFNTTSQETVNFLQPSASSVAINRIYDTNGTQFLGHLNANGQVYLINPNGILFGQGAQVNVGGLVASTLDLNDATLNGSTKTFSGNGTGSIVNQGTLNAANGGYIALLGNKVSNQGTISAQLGIVALGAGSAATLTFNGNSLVHLQVDQSTLNNLAENRQLILADGGQVLMSAGAKDALLASVVNNSGVIEARTVGNHEGVISLLGGMKAGTANIGGTLDASAPNGGNGGQIETSAAHVEVANGVKVTTQAKSGHDGNWLIDPQDFTVAASGGDMTGLTLSTTLTTTPVTLQSSSGGTAGPGNININDAVSWSANTTLTLTASNNITINKNITATGDTAGLVLNPNTANGTEAASGTGTYSLNNGASITLSGSNPSLSIGGTAYTVINSLGVAGDTSGTTLQGINGNLTGHYALGSNIDASSTSTWNSGAGFTPIGSFSGMFDGLGHTVSGLTINTPSSDRVGLFGYVSNTGTLQNVGMLGDSVSGHHYVGGLAGYNAGTISNAYTTGSVVGGSWVGGLVGLNYGTLSNTYATGSVSGSGSTYMGGLVGDNYSGTIINSYSTGSVTGDSGSAYVGGLVGFNNGTVSNVYSTSSVTGGSYLGGLVGDNYTGTVSNAYATGNAAGGSGSGFVGGLVGLNHGTVSNAYAMGNVSGGTSVGGLVGDNLNGTVSNTYATGSVSGNSAIGGLAGYNNGTFNNSYWNSSANALGIGSGTVTGATGLTTAQMQIASNFAGFNFTTTPGATGNNWVMVDVDGSLNNASGMAGATRPMLASEYSTTINNAHQLQLIAMSPSASYTLSQNIDATATASGKDVWSSAGFVPVGNSSTHFTGTFDGLGHTISSLTINRPSNGNVGLFGYVGSAGTVQNVGMLGGSVSGNSDVGGLVGLNYGGTISNAYATGSVSGTTDVGGLVGGNNGTISNSYATGSVSGTSYYVGGLVGYNTSTINNAYATGSVSGRSGVGGLVGYNNYGTINNAYATGSVTGAEEAGGLVGYNYGTLSNAFYDIDQTSINGGSLVTAGGIYHAQYQDWISHGQTLNIANYASLPAGGGGYYNVGSVQGLKDMLGFAENPAYSFRLTGNVDLSAAPGLYIPYFVGAFDGNNNVISNLLVNLPNYGYVGMFGQLKRSGSVSNLGIVNANVTGEFYVGGLVGFNDGGTVSNAYSTGSVSGTSNYVGGLVGNNSGGTISNAYATGSVSGTSYYVGGLVGGNYGTISNAYATGSVSGTSYVGGLAGQGYGTISNAFWNIDINTTGVGFGSATGATGLTSSQMQMAANFAGFNFTTTPGATGNNWVMVDADGSLNNINDSIGSTRPMLASEYSTTIGNAHQLQLMAMKPSASYTMVQNVDASATATGKDVWGSDGFVPIGYAGFGWNNFNGMFDGQGHTISNLTINRPSGDYVGLFGYIGVGATVQNVGMLDGSVSGNYDVGVLAGLNNGTLSNVFATGSVSGVQGVGGLVGENYGTISNAHATGSVSGTGSVGGLAGYNYGTVSNAYASASVTGNTEVGGLVGYNYGGRFSNAYYDIDQVSINGGTLLTAGGIYHGQYQDWIGHGQTLDIANYASLSAGNGGYYNVSSIQGLKDMLGFAESPAYNFRLTGNIDLSSVPNFYIPYFSGTFDGNNNVIANLLINNIPNSNLGMFGQLTGSVTNLGVDNANISGGNRYIGGLAGKNDGTISNAHASGSVNGYLFVGGLVGENDGTVSDAYASNSVGGNSGLGGLVGGNFGTISNARATGSVNGYGSVGGLVGENSSGVISNAYATGSVSGDEVVGGLVGHNYDGLISNAYATGNVTGWAEVGGLVGMHGGQIRNSYATGKVTGSGYDIGGLVGMSLGTIENSYATGSVSGAGNVGGLIGDYNQGNISNSFWNGDINAIGIGSGVVVGASGLTTAQMQTQASFSGWDFANTWVMYEGHTYPLLRSFMTPLTVTANDAVKTYDGQAYAGGNGVSYSSTPNGNLLGTVSYGGTAQGAVNASCYGITPGGLYSNQQGYIIGYANGTLTVNPATITVTGSTAGNKVYDGTTTATLTGGTLVGVIAGDTLTLNQSGFFTTKNVGTHIAVTATDSLGGASDGNYTLVEPTGLMANITPKTIKVTATGVNKVYDGKLADPAMLSSNGIVVGDTVDLSYGWAGFLSKNVGKNKLVLVVGINATGADAGNYIIANKITYSFAQITPAPLTVVGATANNKVYDGTKTATLTGGTLSGVITGDTVTLKQSGKFATKNIGNGIAVTATDSLGGASAGNYTLTEPTELAANITPN